MSDQMLQNTVFEINDYTTASNWERFIALVEEIITQWSLNNSDKDVEKPESPLAAGDICKGVWHEKHEILRYGDSAFDIRYLFLEKNTNNTEDDLDKPKHPEPNDLPKKSFRTQRIQKETIDVTQIKSVDSITQLPTILQDIMSTKNDFSPKAHCLVRWYGLRRMMIISPRGDTIISENRVRVILSALCISLSNTNCRIPFFVQVHNPKNHFYQGISDHSNIRTFYQMVLSRQEPLQYTCLSDLVGLFREKISLSLDRTIDVAVRLTYFARNFRPFDFPSNEEQCSALQDELTQMSLSFFSEEDLASESNPKTTLLGPNTTFLEVVQSIKICSPIFHRHVIQYIQLGVTWAKLSDKVIIDTRVHSDLDPVSAPIWTVRCVSRQSSQLSLVYQTILLCKLFFQAIDYCYKDLDGQKVFENTTSEDLKKACFKLSYEMSVNPEADISRLENGYIKKIVTLIFYLSITSSQLDHNVDEIGTDTAIHRKSKPSTIDEIYYEFRKTYDDQPVVKEYILRCLKSRPYSSSNPLPQRMFAQLSNNELRLCGAFSEFCG